MGITRYHLKENKFILSKFTCAIDNQVLKQQVRELMQETEEIPDFRELSDCKKLENIEMLTVEGTTSSAKK